MNVEVILTEELQVVAGGMQPPPPPIEALVRRAEKERTRARVTRTGAIVLVAAAVVGAVVIGTQIGRPTAAPSPTHPTPTKTADAFPVGEPLRTYVDPVSKVLYLDGVAESGHDWTDAQTVGDLTLGYLGAPERGAVAVFLGTKRVGTIHRYDLDEVMVSPSRRTIAWVEAHGATGAIVVAEVSAGGVHELGRLSVATLVRDVDDESREGLMSVDDDHTVTYGGVLGGHSWRPGSQPKPADISAFMYSPAGFPARAEDIHLNPSGSWGAWLTNPRDPGAGGGEASWASVTFQQPGRPATKTRIAMPAGDNDVRSLYWESEIDIILTTYTGDVFVHQVNDYVRCNVIDRACELAPGWGDH